MEGLSRHLTEGKKSRDDEFNDNGRDSHSLTAQNSDPDTIQTLSVRVCLCARARVQVLATTHRHDR